MSRSKYKPGRPRMLKLQAKYSGWIGEGCWRSLGKRFIKNLEHRANRRYGKLECKVNENAAL